jgi:hypothetical protein
MVSRRGAEAQGRPNFAHVVTFDVNREDAKETGV